MCGAAKGELHSPGNFSFERSGALRCRNPVRVVLLASPACRACEKDKARTDRYSEAPLVGGRETDWLESAWEELGRNPRQDSGRKP